MSTAPPNLTPAAFLEHARAARMTAIVADIAGTHALATADPLHRAGTVSREAALASALGSLTQIPNDLESSAAAGILPTADPALFHRARELLLPGGLASLAAATADDSPPRSSQARQLALVAAQLKAFPLHSLSFRVLPATLSPRINTLSGPRADPVTPAVASTTSSEVAWLTFSVMAMEDRTALDMELSIPSNFPLSSLANAISCPVRLGTHGAGMNATFARGGVFCLGNIVFASDDSPSHDDTRRIGDCLAAHNMPLIRSSMSVLLQDVTFTLNSPFSLVHDSGCEHGIMLTDIRLAGAPWKDDLDTTPANCISIHFLRHHSIRKCFACLSRPATIMSENDLAAATSPALWCQDCFREVHCDKGTGESVIPGVLVHVIPQ